MPLLLPCTVFRVQVQNRLGADIIMALNDVAVC